jgi:hypothetical protein
LAWAILRQRIQGVMADVPHRPLTIAPMVQQLSDLALRGRIVPLASLDGRSPSGGRSTKELNRVEEEVISFTNLRREIRSGQADHADTQIKNSSGRSRSMVA